MRLFIAEKPSLARAIAEAMPGRHRRERLHIACEGGDVIAWCAGHVLEMAPPEDYSNAFERWTLDTLPIVPQAWKHRVTADDLVESMRALLAKALRVVHAGDPDREGQLLVDEVLLHLGWPGPTERLLVTDLSPEAVRAKLGALEPNERYRPLYEAALARQRADWLYGLNLTRLYTLRARLGGYREVVSVGRVQTPLLGLIVRRDLEIEAFVSKPFFGVEVLLRTSTGATLRAAWAVGKEEHAAALDPEGRLLDRELAARLAARVAGKMGRVTGHEAKPHSEEAPLPYSLATLQIDAGRQLGLSAARVVEVAQRLYERQLLTYPRSDCSYLPEAQRQQARGVLEAVGAHAPALASACAAADLSRRSRAWDDRRVTAHHGIIPTASVGAAELDVVDRSLYELVARRYVQQFMAEFEYLQTRVEVQIDGERFIARGRRTLVHGWRALQLRTAESEPSEEERDDTPEETVMPSLTLGESLACAAARVLEKRTRPPKLFTDATLIQAMCHVAKYVTNPQARKILVDTDGIGTPATRAEIIERLFRRGYIERHKKQIRSTPVGRALVAALPTVATTPDMTAVWEAGLARIQDRQLPADQFLTAVQGQLAKLVARGKAAGPLVLPEVLRKGAGARNSGTARRCSRRSRNAAARPPSIAGATRRRARA